MTQQSKTLVLLGHSDPNSLCKALADAYFEGAERAGKPVQRLYLGDLDFDPVLREGYNVIQPLEPDLVNAQQLIQWAEHIVFVYPNWWGTMPALMKGFFDRAFLPGFAFKYRDDSPWWAKLLAGRTAHLIVTMDTPSWYYRWIYRRPGYYEMKRTILGFCGIKVVKRTEFCPVKDSSAAQRAGWLAQVERMGAL